MPGSGRCLDCNGFLEKIMNKVKGILMEVFRIRRRDEEAEG